MNILIWFIRNWEFILAGIIIVLWIWFLSLATEIEEYLNDEYGWNITFPGWMK